LAGVCALAALAATPLRAQQVQAALAQDTTAVGQPVQLNISITGGRGVRIPDRINIEGLDVTFRGKSEQTQVTMANGKLNAVTSSVYTYLVVPFKAGDFTIPSLAIEVGGKVLNTAPLKLTVRGTPGAVPVLPAIPVPQGQARSPATPPTAPAVPANPGAQPAPSNDPQPDAENEVAFGDLVLPRESAYVGEVVPVQIRFFFNANFQVQLNGPLRFTGDGFTVLGQGEPIQRQQVINGQTYNVVIVPTAVVAAKAGKLELAAAEQDARIVVPYSNRNADDFFGGLLGGFGGDVRDIAVKSKPLTLDIKPLPKDGRPAEFGGAIGRFGIEAEASPKKAAAGDPISLKVTITGQGNFNAMAAPVLVEADGWRTYPPGEKFTPSASDRIGFIGDKVFDYMILAREPQKMTPVAEFSYFDPDLEKYVTLKSPPIAVDAQANPAAATPAPAVAAAAPTATPAPEAANPDNGVLARTFHRGTFQSLVQNPVFLAANGTLALAWLGVLLFGLGRKMAGSESARQAAAKRETRKLLARMEARALPAEEFLSLGAQFVAARVGSDQREALRAAGLPETTLEAVEALLDRHDELKYSTAGATTLETEERKHLIAQLKTFDEQLD
jgi:hypothetical protein